MKYFSSFSGMKENEFPPPTREEKERMVIHLYGQNKTIREIAKVAHMSFSDIGRILRARQGYLDEPKKETLQISQESQAFSLFRKGKSLIEVKIELDISSNDVLEHHKKYRELENDDGYNRGYNAVQGNIAPYLQLFNLMNQLGMTPEQVVDQVNYGKMLPQLKNIYSKLVNDIQASQTKLSNLNSELTSSDNKLQVSKHWFEYYNNEYVQKSKQLTGIVSEIDAKKHFIKHFEKDEGYNRIKNVAADQANLLLRDLRLQIIIIISATIEVIRKYPANAGLISDILAFKDNSGSDQNLWMHSHWAELLRLADHVHDEIIKEMTDVAMGMAVSSTNFIQPDEAT
jgi:hypothetical protein